MGILRKTRAALGLTGFEYAVPKHANTFWYSLGGLTLIVFSIAFISGIILTQFYNPSPTTARASVNFISITPGLSLVRSLHHWSANVGFALLLLHMLRTMFTGAYRPPRILTYLFGLALLGTAFQMFFTGTVLKWDQEGYEALGHFIAVNELLGPPGRVFAEDFTFSTSMLARIYGLHIGLFPILFLIFIVIHALYVKHFGISPKPYQDNGAYQKSMAAGETFLKHSIRLSIYGIIILILLLALAFLFPPHLGPSPKPGVEITKPPWLFWVFYPIESAIGIKGILIGSVVVGAGLLLIPLFGLLIKNEKALFRLVNTLVILGLAAWAILMVITYFSPVMQHM